MGDDATVDAEAVLAQLACGGAVSHRAVVVVAHPDDEVLGLGASLARLEHLKLIHATDGAAGGAGEPAEVAGGRFAELGSALSILGCRPDCSVRLDHPDGRLAAHMRTVSDRLSQELAGAEVVITHAFEGGHPDHDACAIAVQLACSAILASGGRPPVRLEFAIYALIDGAVELNRFAAGRAPHTTIVLSARQRELKAAALKAFHSQEHVVSRFPLESEVMRAAPDHDPAAPRDLQTLLFARSDPDREARWRTQVASALARV